MTGDCVFVLSWVFLQDLAYTPELLTSFAKMNQHQLQDRLHWGMNRTANILGRHTDAYRPNGAGSPIELVNRYLRLKAIFCRADGSFDQAVGYGVPEWRGIFDAAYTKVGDYLVQGGDVWFIISQQPLLPVLCVKSNRVISIRRPGMPTNNASLPSGLPDALSMKLVVSQWPVSILGIRTNSLATAGLPGDISVPSGTIWMPSSHGQQIQRADMITDDNGTTWLVVSAELTDHGWRLNIRMVTT